MLMDEDPERCKRLVWHIRARELRGGAPDTQAQLDSVLDWIAEKLPFPIVAPESVLWDLRYLADGWARSRLHSATVEFASELLRFSDEEWQELERGADYDEDEGSLGGRRAARLTETSPASMGRFSQIGIDGVAAAFLENGPPHGFVGSNTPERWRTRERRRRPRTIDDTASAVRLLAKACEANIEALRATLKRGRPSIERQAARKRLAVAVRDLRSSNRVAVGALAEALKCDPATVWRLVQYAEFEIARSRDMEGEGTHSSMAA